jgi:hypothetical protein
VVGKAVVEDIRALIEKEAGEFEVVKYVTGGLNSEVSVIIESAGIVTFVKGRRADHPWAWTQERERSVNPAVLPVSPCLRWSARGDAWDLNGFEYVAGRPADYAPGSADLPKVARMLGTLQELPCPDTALKRAEERWADYTDRPEILAGSALLHTDWTPGNVLVGGRAYLVDWAWPTRGAAWIDPACWVVWLIASGHSPRQAEQLAGCVRSWRDAPPDPVSEFARVQARMWDGIAADSPVPWIEAVAGAARQWAAHRDTWAAGGEGRG